jgi:MFS transporter, MHS family, proline/betaine transporter
MKKSLLKTVMASLIGNLFEWYDFALFGYFAPVVGKLFFPSGNKAAELIAAFGAFAAGYVIRPIGGLIFGYIGDRMGRKEAMVLSILLMAIPTALIGVLPTYGEIGIWAPLSLMAIRMLQGISMGGNYGGSITFTTEHADPARRGLVGSFTVTSCLVGILAGSGAAALASTVFSEAELMSWGWRIPFIVGILICFVGFYIRRNVPESPEYIASQEAGEIKQNPLKDVFTQHGRTLFRVVLTVMLHDLSFYILLVYMATHLSAQLGLSQGMALTINTISLVVVSIATVTSAWLSDKIGRKAVLSGAAFLFVIGTIPLLKIINTTADPLIILGAQMVLSIAVGGYFGPLPAFMVEAYPTSIRFSAITITTNISGPLFGGASPLLMAYLIDVTGNTMIPAFYLTIGAVISLLVLRTIRGAEVKV